MNNGINEASRVMIRELLEHGDTYPRTKSNHVATKVNYAPQRTIPLTKLAAIRIQERLDTETLNSEDRAFLVERLKENGAVVQKRAA